MCCSLLILGVVASWTSAATAIRGNYVLSWKPSDTVFSDPSVSICFSGQTDIDKVFWSCAVGSATYNRLKGDKWLSVGGGNCKDSSGSINAWTTDLIAKVINKIGDIKKGYQGILFDIEVDGQSCGAGDAPSGAAFEKAFKAAHDANMKVIASFSHSEPYKMANADDIAKTSLGSSHVHYVSPQMYGCGHLNTGSTSGGNVHWNDYSIAKRQGKILPSLEISHPLPSNEDAQMKELGSWDSAFAKNGILAWPCQVGAANFTIVV